MRKAASALAVLVSGLYSWQLHHGYDASRFIVINLPPLGDFPSFKPPFLPARVTVRLEHAFGTCGMCMLTMSRCLPCCKGYHGKL